MMGFEARGLRLVAWGSCVVGRGSLFFAGWGVAETLKPEAWSLVGRRA